MVRDSMQSLLLLVACKLIDCLFSLFFSYCSSHKSSHAKFLPDSQKDLLASPQHWTFPWLCHLLEMLSAFFSHQSSEPFKDIGCIFPRDTFLTPLVWMTSLSSPSTQQLLPPWTLMIYFLSAWEQGLCHLSHLSWHIVINQWMFTEWMDNFSFESCPWHPFYSELILSTWIG